MSQNEDKKKLSPVIETVQFRLASGNLVKKSGPGLSTEEPVKPLGPAIDKQAFVIKSVIGQSVSDDGMKEGSRRRQQAFKDLKNRQNVTDRSRRAILRERMIKMSFVLVFLLSLFALERYWDLIFPPKMEDPRLVYRKIGAYSQRRNLNKRVLVEQLRYDIDEIKRCPVICVVKFRDDHNNWIPVQFNRNKYYSNLQKIDGRVDVKGYLSEDSENIPVLKVHAIEGSGGIDVYKIIGVE